MKWVDIRKQYPDKFVLLGDLVEEFITENKFRVIEGTVLEVSDDPKEIRKAYRQFNNQGQNVLYAIPSTPQEFIVKNIPYRGLLR